MRPDRFNLLLCFLIGTLALAAPARAQDALDRVAPTVPSRENPADEPGQTRAEPRVEVAAPPSPMPAADDVFVGAVVLKGLVALTPGDFADILAIRLGKALSPADLAALTTAIANRARSHGLVFATAWVAPQRMRNGVLVVHVDEGRIDEIRIDGPEHSAVRAALAPLADGRPARLSDVERRLLLAGDIDGVQIRSSRFFRENEKGVLLVRVTTTPVSGRASFSNEGTKPLGPEQARFDLNFNGPFFSDDSLGITYSSTPFEPRELQYVRGRYEKRLDAGGTEIALLGSLSATRPGAYLETLGIESRSWSAGMSVLQPLSRRRDASLWFEGELGVKGLTQRRKGVLVRQDRISTIRATLYGYAALAGGRLRASTTLSQGLDILDATRPGDPLASRRDASGVFTALYNWSDWTADLNDRFSVRLGVQSQLASRPLLVTEEMGLGGTNFLRGYDWSERTGDRGVAGFAELRFTLKNPVRHVERAQVYGFVDGGRVSNLDRGFGGGALMSAGGGIRLDITRSLGATAELALPLTGARYDTGRPTPKFNFRIVKSF